MEPLTPEQYRKDAERFLESATDAIRALQGWPPTRSRELSLALTNAEQALMWLDRSN